VRIFNNIMFAFATIWITGNSSALTQTIKMSRQGVMPRWGQKLDATTIKMLAAYVHSLGGGEATPAPQEVAVSNVPTK
jgi:cytochrome c oxidase cbb3-type subunit 3